MSTHQDIINPLLTDSYKMVMAYSFFKNGMHEDPTAFELFFRKCPFGGEYVVFAGLSEVMAYLKDYKFTKEHIQYVKDHILPADADPKFFEYLEQLDCSKVIVRAMPEGSLCFPREPLLSLSGPQGICQLIETPLLNLISFPSLIATNASRMRQHVGDARLVEFGLRRAQGPDGALSATQYSYLGGFDGSSNMIAGFKYGIPITGTVAHSFITSFNDCSVAGVELNGVNIKERALHYYEQMNIVTSQGELGSFIAYAQSLPANFLCLVDTYDTINSGIPNFLAVAFALQDAGYKPLGIRLDSGDLGKLSIKAKEIFKHYGDQFGKDSNFKVVASNDINEELLIQLKKHGHSIDVFGIGTNLVTCQKQPALGLVYKLIECNNQVTMKLSEEASKTTLPAQKNVFRLYFKKEDRYVDIISSLDYFPDNVIQAVDIDSGKLYTLKPQLIENMLQPTDYLLSLQQAKENCAKNLKNMNKVTRITNPEKQLILVTDEFYKIYQKKLCEIQLSTVIE